MCWSPSAAGAGATCSAGPAAFCPCRSRRPPAASSGAAACLAPAPLLLQSAHTNRGGTCGGPAAGRAQGGAVSARGRRRLACDPRRRRAGGTRLGVVADALAAGVLPHVARLALHLRPPGRKAGREPGRSGRGALEAGQARAREAGAGPCPPCPGESRTIRSPSSSAVPQRHCTTHCSNPPSNRNSLVRSAPFPRTSTGRRAACSDARAATLALSDVAPSPSTASATNPDMIAYMSAKAAVAADLRSATVDPAGTDMSSGGGLSDRRRVCDQGCAGQRGRVRVSGPGHARRDGSGGAHRRARRGSRDGWEGRGALVRCAPCRRSSRPGARRPPERRNRGSGQS